MKRKLICFLLLVVLCLNSMVFAYAETDTNFVVDELGVLADSELESLNLQADAIYQECGVGIFFVLADTEELMDYDIDSLTGGMTNFYVMLENNDSWTTVSRGIGTQIDFDTESELRDIYDETDTYVDGIRAFLAAAEECFPLDGDVPDGGGSNDWDENDPDTGDSWAEEWLIFDDADLLSTSEEMALNEKLNTISHTYAAQIMICTVDTLEGADIDEYIDFSYDVMEIGYGENYDGVLLLVCMDPREYRIVSNGFADDVIDDDAIEAIGDAFVDDLSDGAYVAAFDIFADKCEYYLDGHINGFPFNTGKNLLICLGIGLVVALIVTGIWKGQLKSVRKQSAANAYVKAGTMQITQSGDFFMYRNVTKTQKQSSSSSGSSGSSRSTGGGSF